MFLGLILCLLFATPGPAQQDLIRRANTLLATPSEQGRAQAEHVLREALEEARGISPLRYADASVVLALFLLGQQRSPESVEPVAEQALRIYEQSSPPVDEAKMALALETLALARERSPDPKSVDSLRARSTAIRTRLINEIRRQDELNADPALRRAQWGFTSPKIRHKPEPAYSEEARLARREGTVRLSAVIDTDGKTRGIALRYSLGFGLDEEACQALKQWQFDPATRDGEPVRVNSTIEIGFRLL